jgi:type II secretory pathway pseudopilin PulG
MDKPLTIPRISKQGSRREGGFTLIEMIIALVIFFIVVMGVFAAFAYATKFNYGNSQRSQALSVLQKEVELLRSAKFTPATVSQTTTPTPTCATLDNGSRDITGGTKAAEVRCGVDGTLYQVFTTIDDDPVTAGIQTDVVSIYHPNLKEIMVEVIPAGAKPNEWVTANKIVSVFRRVKAN